MTDPDVLPDLDRIMLLAERAKGAIAQHDEGGYATNLFELSGVVGELEREWISTWLRG